MISIRKEKLYIHILGTLKDYLLRSYQATDSIVSLIELVLCHSRQMPLSVRNSVTLGKKIHILNPFHISI